MTKKPNYDGQELAYLLESVLDTGSETHWARLAEILDASPEARTYYVGYMQLRALMLQNGVAAIARKDIPSLASAADVMPGVPMSETMILPAISSEEACSLDQFHEDALDFPAAPNKVEPERGRPRFIGRNLAAVLLVAITVALTLAIIWSHRGPVSVVSGRPAKSQEKPGVSTSPVPALPPVAQMTHVVGAMWGTAIGDAQPSLDIAPRTHLSLLKGYVELTFDNGATAILEGPADFTIVSDLEMTLASGRVAARVPLKAHGFSVQTTQGTITDLGTEFGVVANTGGTTQFDVFKGSVSVAPVSVSAGSVKGVSVNPASTARVFVAGQAAIVSDGTIKLDPAGVSAQRYVRSFSSQKDHLDVIDLMSGGDGTTQNVGMAIDAHTGEAGMNLKPIGELAGNSTYHRVTAASTAASTGVSVVDGSFVPDGTKGPMQVDSAGHTFLFPATTGHSFNRIWTGGIVPWPADQQPVSSVVNGVDYSQSPHRFISLHSNQAVTLDLAAIRRLHAAEPIVQFSCAIANTYGAAPSAFDVYVIVDGVARFERHHVVQSDGKIDVNVPLQATDRFLTLVTADGDKSIWGDWAVWCDPVLATGHP